MIDPPTNPALCPDAGLREPTPRLCARRLNGRDKRALWCSKPEGHADHGDPDCQGVSKSELPVAFADLGPGRVPGWGR